MNTNRDYFNYVTRHMDMLNQIMGQMEQLNSNMYNTYGRQPFTNGSRGATNQGYRNRPYGSVHRYPTTQQQNNNTMGNNTTTRGGAGATRGGTGFTRGGAGAGAVGSGLNNNTNNIWTNVLNSLFWEPVNVRASEEQIEAATSGVEFEDLPEDVTTCPITMEPFNEDSDIVRIDGCGHHFSRRHIHRWFQNHVTCPVCRHDIRGNEAANNAASENAAFVSTNDVAPNAAPNANQGPVSITSTQPLTYQFDISMNSQDLVNSLLQGTGLGNTTSTGQNNTGLSRSNNNTGYTETYYNFPYPPGYNRDSSL